jgi:hypothetical protein
VIRFYAAIAKQIRDACVDHRSKRNVQHHTQSE